MLRWISIVHSQILFHVPDRSEGLGSNANDDLEVVNTQTSADDDIFDAIVGQIEDIFMGKNTYDKF